MGSHKSKENGYMQMGARLYNAETGRFMSVDPLMEIFTGHSPYHYSYNNPVMFRDPSGLAPEGEKNNTVQAEGADNISSGYTCGYWTTKVTFSYKNYFTKNLDDPLAPRGRTFHSDETITIENTFIPISGARGGGGVSISMPESNGGFNGNRNSSRITYNNTTNKSMRDQNAVSDNTRVQKEPQLQNFDNLLDKLQIAQEIDRRNSEDFENFVMKPLTYIGNFATIAELNKARRNMIGFGEQYWKGRNGKWYSTSWGGNGPVGGKNKVLRLASYFRAIGYTAGVFSIVYSGYNAIKEFNDGGNYETHLHDISMTVVGFGGILGYTLSGAYFYSKYAPGVGYNSLQNSFIQDNTETYQNYMD